MDFSLLNETKNFKIKLFKNISTFIVKTVSELRTFTDCWAQTRVSLVKLYIFSLIIDLTRCTA